MHLWVELVDDGGLDYEGDYSPQYGRADKIDEVQFGHFLYQNSIMLGQILSPRCQLCAGYCLGGMPSHTGCLNPQKVF